MSYDISKIKFQTYSWGFGTTSFRESELKYKIEKQLIILENYREDKKDIKWKDFQIEYFSHLVEDELAKSTANDKQKDARIKTSSLKDLGLVNKERFLQNTAIELLEIVKANTKKDTNIFGINKDNFLYLKQFLKMEFSKNIENDRYASFSIKPFIAIIYSLLMKNNKLPRSFFNTRDLTFVSQFTEADTADTVFSQVCMWTSTDSAAAVFSCGEFLFALLFDFHCCLSHESFLLYQIC